MNNSPPGLITLVGTVHRDPRGQGLLLDLLRELQPDRITLEMSLSALAYRQGRARVQLQRLERILDLLAARLGRNRQNLGSHPAVTGIRELLALPFEYRAAAAFAEQEGLSLDLIDISAVSARKLRRVETELVTYRNLRILVDLPDQADGPVGEDYRSARYFILGSPPAAVRQAFLKRRRGREGIGLRDRWMERAIRRRLRACPGGHLVHIGGWVHLLEDREGETLFSRLRDLELRRRLLL